MDKIARGKLAEDAAVQYLQSQGYRIVERNFRSLLGEIDIITEHEGYLVFVEVRSRRGSRFGLPQETVNSTKQGKVRRMATQYLKLKGAWQRPCRFDVVGVILNQADNIQSVELIKDAF